MNITTSVDPCRACSRSMFEVSLHVLTSRLLAMGLLTTYTTYLLASRHVIEVIEAYPLPSKDQTCWGHRFQTFEMSGASSFCVLLLLLLLRVIIACPLLTLPSHVLTPQHCHYRMLASQNHGHGHFGDSTSAQSYLPQLQPAEVRASQITLAGPISSLSVPILFLSPLITKS